MEMVINLMCDDPERSPVKWILEYKGGDLFRLKDEVEPDEWWMDFTVCDLRHLAKSAARMVKDYEKLNGKC